jgi:hypothetical protein
MLRFTTNEPSHTPQYIAHREHMWTLPPAYPTAHHHAPLYSLQSELIATVPLPPHNSPRRSNSAIIELLQTRSLAKHSLPNLRHARACHGLDLLLTAGRHGSRIEYAMPLRDNVVTLHLPWDPQSTTVPLQCSIMYAL